MGSRPFEEAKKFVHSLGLKSQREWRTYIKSGKKPIDIPTHPELTYKDKGWISWGDWFDTGYIAAQDRQYRSFEEARNFVHKLGLKSAVEWMEFCKSGNKPADIPSDPYGVYKDEWISFVDWLGYEERLWSIGRVKELLKDLIESKIIYDFSEVRLYDLLNSNGVLNLASSNRHSQFFKDLIEARHNPDDMKAIEDYANSDSEEPPNLSSNNDDDEIKIATSPEELAEIVNGGSDPLDYGKINTPEQILKQTDFLESICVDEEKMQFQVGCSVQDLWKSAFENEVNNVHTIKSERLNGNKFHDAIIEEFLSDYEAIQKIRQALPKGYSFPAAPKLMQLYVAHKINTRPHFGNFSGTGAGKTLSAILASRIIDSKMTVIVCPNDVVKQWKDKIIEAFPDSSIITGKPAFYAKRDESKHQYLVLNYDKFSQDYSNNVILNLVKQKIDFLVLDEVHFVKQRHDKNESQRHECVFGLRKYIGDKNNDAKVLAMSATPVINNIREGRSQLELLTAKEYIDVATKATIPNAVTLHQKLALLSIREKRNYAKVNRHDIEVEAPIQGITKETIRQLKRNPLWIEKILTPARIPKIINLINGKTIIYTEYVTEIIEQLEKAVAKARYSYALYTGEDHSGLSKFLDKYKNIQVLIASRPIAIGVDGLQHICNRLIINTLPWTNAMYEQLIGRLVRIDQTKEVDVFVIKASLGHYPYDELIKWKRIQFKRSLADCAVDGTLPKRNLVTPQQAAKAAVEWLERLERGEISTITRRDLDVELSPEVEIQQRIIHTGEFTKLNNKINKENSETTHERMKKNPEEFHEYHRQYSEQRKIWRKTHGIIPYEVMIEKIKGLSQRKQIGDFGCGEAYIAQTFGKKRVNSFDHVAINDNVTACDMKKVPLEDGAIDVAVFSLSLMGRNWPDYIVEAKRCLAKNELLFIAETTSSLSARLAELRNVIKEQGFEIYSDEERGDFTFIEARKLRVEYKVENEGSA
jgi:superfamily II DNA or RNA helicase